MNVQITRQQISPPQAELAQIPITSNGRSIIEVLGDLKGDLTGLYRDQEFYEQDFVVRSVLGRKLITALNTPLIEHILLKNPGNYQRGKLQKSTVQPWAGDGILTSEGATWKKQRKVSEPWFFRHKIDHFVPTITQAALQAAAELEEAAQTGASIDIEEYLLGFSTRVIARSLFSTDIEPHFAELREILDEVQQRMARVGFLDLVGFGHHFRRLSAGKAQKLNRRLHDIFDQIITERLEGGVRRNDFLQAMVDTEDAESGKRLSRKQIYDTAISYFLGAPESVGYSLIWTFYLLSHNAHAQDRAAKEAREFALAEANIKSLEALEFSWTALQEAMRLYPPVHSFTREAIQADQFQDLKIPKRSLVFFPVYSIHRHTKLWDEPNRFDPDRFSKSRRQSNDHLRFLAFSAGPRFCLGRSLAEMETKIALAVLLGRFRFEPDPDRPVTELEAFVTLRPKNGCHVRVSHR